MDGVTYRTAPIQMKASFQRPLNPGSATNLYKEDLVFTRVEVDKHEVFQGEPIVLSMQLWRIIHGGIDSGSHPRAVIRHPSTEGFYEALLEPRSDVRKQGSWEYNVIEDRKLLYPTSTGELNIGSWHWEGRAYVPSKNRRSRFLRDAYEFKLDSDLGPLARFAIAVTLKHVACTDSLSHQRPGVRIAAGASGLLAEGLSARCAPPPS